ncbi:DNA-directed RNA polymerase II 16 kDa subunit, putative [Plasmodium berghei]|uniref:DNA-directed RNA polymerase II 16 kDa subunit, putative n=1 Tax=Plasmodium berghei TaxID=5821 RepID=A0A1C6WP05_PLABE|nr:DNA-directed RNA polymerase II 16 kDa subunit, putative [Plasmodium berghei]SCM15332.1 DNA-directed RNA polymerase II 16 kDa subunit, putative [Plasmodium berghei]SCN22118.1 DNA-directed RNA polymerase II 16 kDa subunit, putative [Plasmodium berghei]
MANNNSHGNIQDLNLGPEFQNCKCLNLCELQLILGDQLRLTSKRNEDAQALIRSSFDYANRFATIKNRSSIVDIRTNLERIGELYEYEIAMLVNLLPKTILEARYFIPSLIRLNEETLHSILEHLIIKKFEFNLNGATRTNEHNKK